jgi:thiamine biosynthesis protein ThiI
MDPGRHDVAVVHYNEIALKLGHRAMFVNRLVQNVRNALAGLGVAEVRSAGARIDVVFGSAAPDSVIERLAATPGIANILLAESCPRDLEAVEHRLLARLERWQPHGSFRVAVKRADKTFPIPSPEIGRRLGAAVVRATGAPVDLKRAASTIHVEVVRDAIYLSLDAKIGGCGGLPVSTAGRVLLLLSGGIDSPVAGLRMMRRGCRVDAVHFHSIPYLDTSGRDKARRLSGVLACGQGTTRLALVAFGDIQSEIVTKAPRRLRVVLYRRMMMRIASRIARLDGATALVTGDSLGQVASQTLANLSVIERASELPVLRPLVGMDKLEIMQYAQRAGTFDISVLPDQDCCSLFVPRHPATAAKLTEVEQAESALDLTGLVERACDAVTRECIDPEWRANPQADTRQV